jgi:Transmembrane amino acid transporter protein
MAGSIPLGGLGLVTDPREGRRSVSEATGSYPLHILKKLHDPDVPFEEYLHFAKISREDENRLYGPGSAYREASGPIANFVKTRIVRRESITRQEPRRLSLVEAFATGKDGFSGKEKAISPERASTPDNFEITDEEWITASRAARTATWGAIFYLIATDILGPFSTGWAFSQLGWGPAVALYTVFGTLSGYTGYQLWRMFIQMDSDRYPMKDFGDFGFRVYGTWCRHLCNVLQSFQFFFNVALIIISSGQSISQMAKGNLCFIICVLVSAIAGCIVGQIRTLARFGWLASLAVAVNLFVIFSSWVPLFPFYPFSLHDIDGY